MEVDLHLFHVRWNMEISYLSSVALYDPLKITMKPNACDFVTLLRSVFCVSAHRLGRAVMGAHADERDWRPVGVDKMSKNRQGQLEAGWRAGKLLGRTSRTRRWEKRAAPQARRRRHRRREWAGSRALPGNPAAMMWCSGWCRRGGKDRPRSEHRGDLCPPQGAFPVSGSSMSTRKSASLSWSRAYSLL